MEIHLFTSPKTLIQRRLNLTNFRGSFRFPFLLHEAKFQTGTLKTFRSAISGSIAAEAMASEELEIRRNGDGKNKIKTGRKGWKAKKGEL